MSCLVVAGISTSAVGGEEDAGVAVGVEAGGVGSAETRLATMASAPLRWSLARAFWRRSVVSAANPMMRVRGAAGDGLGEDVGGGLELEGDGAVALDLLVGGVGDW